MTKAEKICANVSDNMKAQVVTLADAVLALQEKIEQQIPTYLEMPLAQQVTVGTGETMLRQNPMTQEFRATVREYAQALEKLNAILDAHDSSEKRVEFKPVVIGGSRWKKASND